MADIDAQRDTAIEWVLSNFWNDFLISALKSNKQQTTIYKTISVIIDIHQIMTSMSANFEFDVIVFMHFFSSVILIIQPDIYIIRPRYLLNSWCFELKADVYLTSTAQYLNRVDKIDTIMAYISKGNCNGLVFFNHDKDLQMK